MGEKALRQVVALRIATRGLFFSRAMPIPNFRSSHECGALPGRR